MDNPGESLNQKEKYQQKIDDILSVGLTAENIDIYSDNALEGLTSLIDEIKNDSSYKWDFTLNLSTREQENEMFRRILGIDVDNVLEGIIRIGDDIKHLGSVVNNHRQDREQKTYVPTEKLGFMAIVANGGDFSRAPIVPKAKTTLFLLENDFGVDLNNEKEFQMFTGVNSENMMRQVSYDIINLPLLNRAILSCDEIGNRTFIFDTGKFEEKDISLDNIKNMTKQEILKLLDNNSELGASLKYSKNYLVNLSELIKNPTKELAERIEESPDQFGQGKQYLKETMEAPDGWVTISNFTKNHEGIDLLTLKKLIKTSGLEAKEFRVGFGSTYLHYREEDLEALASSILSIGKAPDGWVTIRSFANNHDGIDQSTLRKLIKTSGLKSKEFRIERGQARSHYKEEDLEALAGPLLSVEKAPEGWVTIRNFAENHDGITHKTLSELVKTSGLEPKEFRVEHGQVRLHYKEKDLEALASSFINTEKVPDGWVTVNEFVMSHNGITHKPLNKMIKDNNLESKVFRTERGHVCAHYKKEDLEAIASFLLNMEKVPAGWVTIGSYVDNHKGILHKTLSDIIKANGLEPKEFRTERGKVFSYYKEEDLDKIISERTKKR